MSIYFLVKSVAVSSMPTLFLFDFMQPDYLAGTFTQLAIILMMVANLMMHMEAAAMVLSGIELGSGYYPDTGFVFFTKNGPECDICGIQVNSEDLDPRDLLIKA